MISGKRFKSWSETATPGVIGALLLVGLYLASRYNYLLFHSFAEMFSIIVAMGIFFLAWNARRFMDNDSLLFLGIAYPIECTPALLCGDFALPDIVSGEGIGIHV